MNTLHKVDYCRAAGAEHDNIWCDNPEPLRLTCAAPEPGSLSNAAAGAIEPQVGFMYAFDNGADFICVGMYDFRSLTTSPAGARCRPGLPAPAHLARLAARSRLRNFHSAGRRSGCRCKLLTSIKTAARMAKSQPMPPPTRARGYRRPYRQGCGCHAVGAAGQDEEPRQAMQSRIKEHKFGHLAGDVRPPPPAIPIWAAASAVASFMPSPAMATPGPGFAFPGYARPSLAERAFLRNLRAE
jgi:hypothetical protein